MNNTELTDEELDQVAGGMAVLARLHNAGRRGHEGLLHDGTVKCLTGPGGTDLTSAGGYDVLPSSGGSDAYEDRWPRKGDFDFNDLILSFR